jgi:N-acetylneuraminic acid mutarotase/predicted neuraminidase
VFPLRRARIWYAGLLVGWNAVGCFTQAASAAPADFERFVIPAPANAALCAYPSLARLSDDRLLCVFSAYDGSRNRKIFVAGTVSVDHGRAWSSPQVLIDSPDGNDYDPSIVVIGSRVIVTATTTPPNDPAITTSRTVAIRSEDSGEHWSTSYEIPMGRHYTSGKVNNGIVTRDGTALLGFTWEKNLETGRFDKLADEGQMEEVNAVLMSFDKGRTWAASESVELDVRKPADAERTAINGVCEPAIVECDDGSIYMLSRTGATNLYGCRSTNGGRSWSAAEKTSLVSHNAPADVCQFAGERRGVLVAWNNSPRNRWPLCVAASFDGCRTWGAAQVIEPQEGVESSYPSCIQAGDGKILVVYQQNKPGGRGIRGVRFDPTQVFGDRSTESPTNYSASKTHSDSTPAPRGQEYPSVMTTRSTATHAKANPLKMNWNWGIRLPRPSSAFGCAAMPTGMMTVGGTYWTSPTSANPMKRWMRDVYWFVPETRIWKPLADFPVEIGQVLLLPVKDRVYAVGGRNAEKALRETYWIEPLHPASVWQRGPDLPLPLCALQGGVSGNVIYAVTDGHAMEELDTTHAVGPPTVLALDTSQSNTKWARIAKVPDPKIGYRTAAVTDGKLLLFGGAELLPDGSLGLTDSVWAFDLEQRTWNACSPLPFPLRDATAVSLDNRHVLVAGGVEDAANSEHTSDGKPRVILSNRSLVYDCLADTFAFAEPLRLAVADHGLVAFGSEILVIGGEDSPYRTRTDLVQRCAMQILLNGATLAENGSKQTVESGSRSTTGRR